MYMDRVTNIEDSSAVSTVLNNGDPISIQTNTVTSQSVDRNAGTAPGNNVDSVLDTNTESSAESSVYYMFLGMGLAMLLPWNLIISASEFYKYQFEGSPYKDTFQNYFSVVYMILNLASTLYAMATTTKANYNNRILFSLLANLSAYIVGSFLPFAQDLRGSASFYITLAQLAVTAWASGILGNALFSLAAYFPPTHTESILSGQAVSGIIATVAQLATAYMIPGRSDIRALSTSLGSNNPLKYDSSLANRTVAYFIFASVVNAALTLGFVAVRRLAYFKRRSVLAHSSGTYQPVAQEENNSLSPSLDRSYLENTKIDLSVFSQTYKQISGLANSTLLSFSVTLAVFPSVTAYVTSTKGFELLPEWHFFLFNVGDFLGRKYAHLIEIEESTLLVRFSIIRVLFIPIFLLCNVSFSVFPNLITSDVAFLALILALGITNGYLPTRSAMAAPKIAENPSAAGQLIALSIGVGLAIGSVLSWPTHALGCLCNPL